MSLSDPSSSRISMSESPSFTVPQEITSSAHTAQAVLLQAVVLLQLGLQEAEVPELLHRFWRSTSILSYSSMKDGLQTRGGGREGSSNGRRSPFLEEWRRGVVERRPFSCDLRRQLSRSLQFRHLRTVAWTHLFTSQMRISATRPKLGVRKFSIETSRGYPSARIISVKSGERREEALHQWT
ncbi:hypothetical protein CRUP_001420 [Coryphaenoides rupestris]|nr:hypothetical protein CRUP_001420 [Coryphaenoides rupestris]